MVVRPRYGYVEQKGWTEISYGTEPGLAAWYISRDIRKPSEIKGWGTPRINGMFYDYLRGWFYFFPDMSLVHINWQIGPRFGRGFEHRIGKDSLGKYLIAATGIAHDLTVVTRNISDME